MIFLTVGSSLPFDRLVSTVDDLVASACMDGVFAQIGETSYRPRHFRWVSSLAKADFDAALLGADFVISHAGIGTISSALEVEKRVIVMPRLKAFGEAVNDHQVSTAKRFGAAGHVLVAQDMQSLQQRLIDVRTFRPTRRQAQPDAVARRIGKFLQSL